MNKHPQPVPTALINLARRPDYRRSRMTISPEMYTTASGRGGHGFLHVSFVCADRPLHVVVDRLAVGHDFL